MGKFLTAAVAGIIFGVGLALSAMTHAGKVLGFLDVLGAWDPSLLFVLGGAVAVTAIAFRFVLRRPAPLLESRFQLPTTHGIDRRLIGGAAIFGVGWGISGYCPGPGIALLAAPSWETWVFVPALFAGALLYRVLAAPRASAPSTVSPEPER